MGRCSGCSGDRCSCKIIAGTGAAVVGAGTTQNPYVVSLSGDGGGGGTGERITGEIIMYGGAVAPAGWLKCEGQTVSRVTYATLFAAISTTYGSGDGANTFHLPDLAERLPIGASPAGTPVPVYPLGAIGGAENVTLVEANMPVHSHTIAQHNHTMAHTHDITHDHPGNATGGVNQNHYHLPAAYFLDHGSPPGQGGAIVVQSHISGVGYSLSKYASTNVESHDHAHATATPAFNGQSGGATNGTTSTSGATSTGNRGGTTAVNKMPPWQSVSFIIKT